MNKIMKKAIFTILCLWACLPMLAATGASSGSADVLFVSNQVQEFQALVGQFVGRTGLVRFADAEIPPDPNTPVVRANGMVAEWITDGIINDDYSLSLEGADSFNFTARITRVSLTSNECTVQITYSPRTVGTHTATLWAYCANAGVPVVKIPLRGEAPGVLGDLNGDGTIGLTDVTVMISKLLNSVEDTTECDMDGDGDFNISDVTFLVSKLLNSN